MKLKRMEEYKMMGTRGPNASAANLYRNKNIACNHIVFEIFQ